MQRGTYQPTQCPSEKRLIAELGLTPEVARQFRGEAKAGYYHSTGHYSHDLADYLERLCALTEYYGVESLFPANPNVWYFQAGDTYTATLICTVSSTWAGGISFRFTIGCWGDLVD